jgi:hypothetical protein
MCSVEQGNLGLAFASAVALEGGDVAVWSVVVVLQPLAFDTAARKGVTADL